MTIPRLFGLAMAAMLLFAATQAPVALAEDEPDLVVEVASKPDQANPRRVVFKVTNKSPNWADETTARVATVYTGPKSPFIQIFPEPTNIKDNIFIENLDPGQTTEFEYILGGDCDGHELDVEVRPAKSWDGTPELEANRANNKLDNVQLCVSTQPVGSGTFIPPHEDNDGLHIPVDVGGCAKCNDNKKPTTIDIPLEKANSELFQDGWEIQNGTRGRMRVGFVQREGNLIRDTETGIARLGIQFDRAKLLTFKGIRITNATITYDEQPDKTASGQALWTSGSGSPQDKPGCVARIMVATERVDSPSGLKYTFYAQHDPASRFIDVTDPIIDFVGGRNQGLVLLGAFDKVDGDDSTSCMSELSNIVLHLTTAP